MSKIANNIGILRDKLEGDQFAQMQLDLIEQHFEELSDLSKPEGVVTMSADEQTFADLTLGKQFEGEPLPTDPNLPTG